MGTLRRGFGKGRRETAGTQEVGTTGLPPHLKNRGEGGAVTRMWKENHVHEATLTRAVIWVKGKSQPKVTLLGGTWEGIFTNLTLHLLWLSVSVPPSPC